MIEDNEFGVDALIENARATPMDRDFTAAYVAHVRRAIAKTQSEIDEAMAKHPELRNLRF